MGAKQCFSEEKEEEEEGEENIPRRHIGTEEWDGWRTHSRQKRNSSRGTYRYTVARIYPEKYRLNLFRVLIMSYGTFGGRPLHPKQKKERKEIPSFLRRLPRGRKSGSLPPLIPYSAVLGGGGGGSVGRWVGRGNGCTRKGRRKKGRWADAEEVPFGKIGGRGRKGGGR